MTEEKSGSPPCGLYIRINDYSNMQTIIAKLRQMTFAINRASGYEKNMCIIELAYDAAHSDDIATLCALARNEGIVSIIALNGDATSILKENPTLPDADGICVNAAEKTAPLRHILGEDIIIGLSYTDQNTKKTPHAPDADYVVLPADTKTIKDWTTHSEIMCVASGNNMTNDTCGDFAHAGANFVEVSTYILEHPKGIVQAIVNIMHALDLAAQRPKILN